MLSETTSPQLVFRSLQFAKEEHEDEATNPGLFGRSLALWLGRELVPGFSPDDVLPEDFGWLVPVPASGCSLYVACSSTNEIADEWRLMVFAERSLRERLTTSDARPEAVAELYARVRERVEADVGTFDAREE